MIENITFTVVAIVLYVMADRLLDWIERRRGARIPHRQLAFFALILPLALATFWLLRFLGGEFR